MKNNTIPIAFHGGTYGTYLEWVLTTLITDLEIIEPFRENGNSHKFNGHHLGNMNGWREYLAGEKYLPMVRFHPKTTKDEDLCCNITEISQAVNRFIYLYPDEDTFILGLHNQYTKVWSDWWHQVFTNELDHNLIYKNWPVDSTTPMAQIPVWIKREFLSYYMIPMWQTQIGWGDQSHLLHENCHVIKTKDLLHDFQQTLTDLERFLDITFVKPIESILDTHKKMLSLQTHLDIDVTCKKITNSIITSTHYAWDPLPLVGEVWIQWHLRQIGYEIRCHGLDIFPCDSVQLLQLIYQS